MPQKVKPVKLYVTDAILEVSASRARAITTKHGMEYQLKRFDMKKIFAVWKEVVY